MTLVSCCDQYPQMSPRGRLGTTQAAEPQQCDRNATLAVSPNYPQILCQREIREVA
jgi:hypothetical protein